jgi:hypothetical protein
VQSVGLSSESSSEYFSSSSSASFAFGPGDAMHIMPMTSPQRTVVTVTDRDLLIPMEVGQ